MLRHSLFAPSLLAIAMLAAAPSMSPANAQSSTIRIEPRPYYGAVVTIEQGVRVWRPLPPTRHMIINPTNAPVSVNVTDVRESVHHSGTVNGGALPYAGGYGGSRLGGPGYFVGRSVRPLGHRYGRPGALRGRSGGGLR